MHDAVIVYVTGKREYIDMTQKPDQTKNDAPTREEDTKPSSSKWKLRGRFRDVTAEKIGHTIAIIGTRQPPPKRKSD